MWPVKYLLQVGFVLSALLIFTRTQILHAQETTIVVGIAGNVAATNSILGNTVSESISTAKIDNVLRVVAPNTFGQNFTRDKANKTFSDFANLRVDLASSLARTIPTLSTRILRVNSVAINTPILDLRLTQKTNSVSAKLGTLSADVSVLVKSVPIICSTANTSFSIKNITFSGDYNYISGNISGTLADYAIENVSVSCNGFFGFIGNVLNSLTGSGKTQVRNAMAEAANRAVAFGNMQQLFSLANFANSLDVFRNQSQLTLPANKAIIILKEMISDANINTPGIVLDINVAFASNTASQNTIRIFASHAPVDITSFTTSGNVTFNVPLNTQQTDIYYKLGSGNWVYFTSTTGNSVSGIPVVPVVPSFGPTFVIGIGRNAIITGLESFPGVSLGVINQVCPGGGITC
jgi:hypothetical protein